MPLGAQVAAGDGGPEHGHGHAPAELGQVLRDLQRQRLVGSGIFSFVDRAVERCEVDFFDDEVVCHAHETRAVA
ncbi:hypothetical protein [Microvirga arabica]|uniref:hypothetical protein n=1 Tax=Microvirga arabica TaxID=1128671 RepID=UPI001939DE3E|nr:hypothetical protein [Microvirga arabica]MBM1170083.1 hypothetical protein [Microvirga arabica]